MPKVPVYNISGAQVGEIELAETIFGIEPNAHVLHEAVVMQQASLRRGTHDVKVVPKFAAVAVSLGDKGTGRARQGSIRAPQWVGGGTVFGPTPRSYAYKLPKKVRRLALKSALSSKVNANEIIVLDALTIDAPKTKDMVQILANLKVGKKALIVSGEQDNNIILSARNIPGVKVVDATGINVLDLLHHDALVITKDAVAKVEEVFA